MDIKVDFTIHVPKEDLPNLRELAAQKTNHGAAHFVRMDAAAYLIQYLTDNAVRAELIREA